MYPAANFVKTILLRFQTVFYILLWALFASNFAHGADHKAEQVRQIVATNVAELVKKYDEERQYYETDPERFFNTMDKALGKIVDFRRFAARVMGKYARKATKEQRDQFVEVFRVSLYETYTKTLVDSGTFKIKVTKAKLNNRSDKRASVDLQVTSDTGKVYPVVYSMHRNRNGQWLMENIIVFGVNVGLAFRDRFETQIRRNKGDVEAVISSWSGQLEGIRPKES